MVVSVRLSQIHGPYIFMAVLILIHNSCEKTCSLRNGIFIKESTPLFLCHNLSHSIRHRYSTETRFHLKVILMVIGLSHSGTMVKSSRIVVYILIHTYIPKE